MARIRDMTEGAFRRRTAQKETARDRSRAVPFQSSKEA
jgi:hypothetical protein